MSRQPGRSGWRTCATRSSKSSGGSRATRPVAAGDPGLSRYPSRTADLRRRGADADLHGMRSDLRDPGWHPGPAARRGTGTGGSFMIDGTAGVRGHRDADESLLDNTAALEAFDPGNMLRHTASGGAQVRESAALAAEANLTSLADEGRPRAVVVAGQGTAARTGDILATVAGPRCPVPVLSHRSPGVPGWVGAADVVIAVSASGRSPEALGAADAAARRGARLVAIGPPDSELQAVAESARAPFIPVPRRAPARATPWGVTIPGLLGAPTPRPGQVTQADNAETPAPAHPGPPPPRPNAHALVHPAQNL